MTLSNIFFGKKVVQQAYLNNALIYQSNGWQTLPSTCTEAWTKNVGIVNSNTVDQCVIDSNNNIYVLVDHRIFKLNSEGILIWSKIINGIERIAIDTNNDVYIALILYDNDGSSFLHIAKLDNNGNIEKEFKPTGLLSNFVTNFALDNNYFYISVYYNNTSNKFLLKIDKQGKVVDSTNNYELNNSTLVASDDSYLYAGFVNNLIKIDKNNIDNYTVQYKAASSYSIKNLLLDGLGNIIFLHGTNDVFRYNFETKTTIKYGIYASNVNCSLALDYQKNLYYIYTERNGVGAYQVYLVKYSSDGSLIFKNQILTDSSNSSGILVTDQYGNVYYMSIDSNQMSIKKLINIEKKGS